MANAMQTERKSTKTSTNRRGYRAPDPVREERMEKVMSLKRMGMEYSAIARTMGCSKSTAHKLYIDGCRLHLGKAGAAEVDRDIRGREDDMLRVLYPQAVGGDQGAVRLIMGINAAQARRYGLDKVKVDISGEIVVWGVDQIAGEIARLEAELQTPALGEGEDVLDVEGEDVEDDDEAAG